MPSPRFRRLPVARRRHLLDVARHHLARDGAQTASYNQIIADAGISKTSAYLYFDGRDDLVAEVFRDLGVRLAACLGAWQPVTSPKAFWKQLRAASDALRRHLVDHPDDLALVARPLPGWEPLAAEPWLDAMLADGRAHEVVRRDIDPELMRSATLALLQVGDAYVIDDLLAGGRGDAAPVWKLLKAMWRVPRSQRSARG